MPWMRSCISWVKPAITLLTTIIVATPSVTLMIDASAMYRVRRYRQQSRNLYMANPWQCEPIRANEDRKLTR